MRARIRERANQFFVRYPRIDQVGSTLRAYSFP